MLMQYVIYLLLISIHQHRINRSNMSGLSNKSFPCGLLVAQLLGCFASSQVNIRAIVHKHTDASRDYVSSSDVCLCFFACVSIIGWLPLRSYIPALMRGEVVRREGEAIINCETNSIPLADELPGMDRIHFSLGVRSFAAHQNHSLLSKILFKKKAEHMINIRLEKKTAAPRNTCLLNCILPFPLRYYKPSNPQIQLMSKHAQKKTTAQRSRACRTKIGAT